MSYSNIIPNCDYCIHYDVCLKHDECPHFEDERSVIQLPCKVGDILYTNYRPLDFSMEYTNKPFKVKVVFMGLSNNEHDHIHIQYENNVIKVAMLLDFDKLFFKTKEEAEARLKEIRNE